MSLHKGMRFFCIFNNQNYNENEILFDHTLSVNFCSFWTISGYNSSKEYQDGSNF